MEKGYFLSKGGSHTGPFSEEQINKKIDTKECQWTDFVFDRQMGDWVMLLEHPLFSAKLSNQKPKNPPEAENKFAKTHPLQADKLKDKEWFIMKEGNNYGPYCYLEVVNMLQRKTLFEYDFVWHSKLATWKPAAEVEEFKPEVIRDLKASPELDISEIFFRRRHARAPYGASLIVHNNKTVFKGKSFEISAGGAGVLIENSELKPGQNIFLHFQPGDGVPPFNAVCEIVSKQFVSETSGKEKSVKYGVKFTKINQSARENILHYTSDHAA